MKTRVLIYVKWTIWLLLVIGLCTPVPSVADPTCEITDIQEGPPLTVDFTINGNGQELVQVVVLHSENATVTIPDIDPSTTTQVIVTATRVDPFADFSVELRARDITGTLTFCEYSREALQDSDPPTCQVVGEDPGPPHTLYVSVQDASSGLAVISVTAAVNADVSIPDFLPGTTAAVLVSVTKLNDAEEWSFSLSMEDLAGNTANCDYAQSAEDLAPPICQVIDVEEGPPTTVHFSVQDTHSGLAAIDIIDSTNAEVSISGFTSGTTQAVIVTASRQTATLNFSVSLQCTDVAGNSSTCEYEFSLDDTEPPVFTITSEDAGPPAILEISVQDAISGLSTLNVVESQNATVSIPGFPQGIVDPPVVFTVTQVDANIGLRVIIEAQDMIGNTATFVYPPELPDVSPPVFEFIQEDAGPPLTILLGVSDDQSGLALLEVVDAINGEVDIPSFSVGTIGRITVSVRQIIAGSGISVTLMATDVEGNSVEYQYPEALTLGKRPEFDAVGRDSDNFFNDAIKTTIIENGLDLSGNPINAFSDFASEIFSNNSTDPFDDPCFSSSSGAYQSAMVAAWNEAVFEWDITLQMKPASDLFIGVVGCILSGDGSSP